MTSDETPKDRIIKKQDFKSLIYSVSTHLALLMIVVLFSRNSTFYVPPEKDTFVIEIKDTPKPITITDEDANKRIVQTTIVNPTKDAAKDAFLGEVTQTVKEQTIKKSQNTTDTSSHEVKEKQAKAQTVAAATKEQQQKLMAEKPKTVATATKEASKKSAPKNFITSNDGPLSKFGASMFKSANPGQALKDAAKDTPFSDDAPTQDLSAASDSTVSNPSEYLKGFRDNDRTVLNTKEYVFFGYFERIRRALDLAWRPILREHIAKFYKKGRTLASDMDMRTKLTVTLNKEGEVVRVTLAGESGVSDLDDAAVRAFNKAGPFPNPPHGLVEKTGEVNINWDFVLKT